MNLRDFFDLGSDEPPRSKVGDVAAELSETSLFRQDTDMKARARDERRVDESLGFAEDAGVLDPEPRRGRGLPRGELPIADDEFVRSPANGRVAVDPEPTPAPGVDRRRGNGRYIDAPQTEADIGRDRETGRFMSRGDR